MAFIDRINSKIAGKENITLYLSLFTTLIFCGLYFNIGINIGGDDSGYVLRAMRFWENGEFPKIQGVIYPLFLAPFYGLTNGNLILLKMISILMFLGSQYFIFFTYKSNFQPLSFLILLLTLSINYYWLTYSSLTYSEALFNLIQFGTIYFFYHRFICRMASTWDVIVLALLGLILLKTRVIGAAILVASFIYFLKYKQWKTLLHFSLISLLLIVLWDTLTHLSFHDNKTILVSQIMGLLQKNPYDASQGSADFILLIQRLFFNLNNYVSKHMMQLLALRSYDFIESNWIFTIATSLLIIVAAFLNRSRNKIIIFSLIYLAVGMIVVLATPKIWSQVRFIQPFIPIIYIVLIYEFQEAAKKKLSWLPCIIALLLLVFQMVHSVHYIKDNVVKIEAYQYGDKYFEHTPDWKNYLNTCEWVGDNIDKRDGKVACRKPHIAALVSKEDNFYGIYKVPDYNCFTIRNKLTSTKEQFIAIDVEKFFSYQIPNEISIALENSYTGAILEDSKNTNWRLFNIREKELYNTIIRANDQMNFVLPIQSLVSEENSYSVSFADSLVQNLKRNNVKYLMVAHLRVYKESRSEEVLSSMHNYMATIGIKYPNMFKQVYQLGLESREPTTVYEINYSDIKPMLQYRGDDQEMSGNDNLMLMYDWAMENTKGEGYIGYSDEGGSLDQKAANRIFKIAAVPRMNHSEFLNFYKRNIDRYIIIDPGQFDTEKIKEKLVSELLKGLNGFVYIGNYMLRLHYIESPKMFKSIVDDDYIVKHIITYDNLLHLSEEEKRDFNVVEPTYMLSELRNKNIQYIIEDNLAKEVSQNIPKKLIFLISRKYPNAFFKVKEIGSNDSNRITLYKINYPVL